MAISIQRVLFLILFLFSHIPHFVLGEYYSYDIIEPDGEYVPLDDSVPFKLHHRIEREAVVDDPFLEERASPLPERPAKELTHSTPYPEPEEEDYSDVGITLPPGNTNKHNFHYYYNSSFHTEVDKWTEYWVDLDNNSDKAVLQVVLSNAYRKGITITLSFDFPFYGHLLRNMTVTTGGFIFTGEQVHSWLAATQYIAPLMANFDPSLTNNSIVKYLDNGTAFTVQWENVQLKDKTHAGNFTFQTTLHKSGDIVFVYREVPVSVLQISEDDHPVKVGLSDAYIIDRTIFFMRRKTIYEYHRIDMRKPEITNTTSIYFTALPTCLNLKDCDSCLNNKIGFECAWCIGRCSDGTDRKRQDWILQGCSQQSDPASCPAVDDLKPEKAIQGTDETFSGPIKTEFSYPYTTTVVPEYMTLSAHNTTAPTIMYSKANAVADHYLQEEVSDHTNLGTAGVVAILFVVAMVFAFAVWVFYAYKNPHTPSGQLLIKYRPSQWTLPKGEARYTAATVHM